MAVRTSMSDELDRDSVFYKKIESNEDICSNCYRRVRYTVPSDEFLPERMNDSTKQMISDERIYREEVDGEYFDDKNNSGSPSVFRRFCPCGSVELDIKLRPLGSDEVMDLARRIEARLEEEQVNFDSDIFYDSVRDKKSDPDKQFNEEKIFEESVEGALITDN